MNEALEELRATLGREGRIGVSGEEGRIGAVVGGVGASRAKVLCVRRWEEVRGYGDDRMPGFPCIA